MSKEKEITRKLTRLIKNVDKAVREVERVMAALKDLRDHLNDSNNSNA